MPIPTPISVAAKPTWQARLKAGDLTILTCGDFEWREVLGLFRAVVDIDCEAEIAAAPEAQAAKPFDPTLNVQFVERLVRDGKLVRVPTADWDLGPHGHIDRDWARPAPE